MNIGRLVVHEIAYRFLNFFLGLVSILTATGCLVAAVLSLDAQEERIKLMAERKKDETARIMAEFEDSTRKNMLKLGFNVLIVHKDEQREHLLAGKSPRNTLPESYVTALTGVEAKDGNKEQPGVLNLNHLLPILREDLVWENRAGVRDFVASFGLNALPCTAPLPAAANIAELSGAAARLKVLSLPVILTGTPGELPIVGKTEKRPLIPVVPKGGILIGDAVQRAFGFPASTDVELTLVREVRYGKEIFSEEMPSTRFKLHRAPEVDRPRGSEHDITIWINLNEAQKLLRKPGQITGIFALECVSPDCPTDRFHDVQSELAQLLPGTQVIPYYSSAAVRAASRSKAAALTRQAIDQEIAQQRHLQRRHEDFAAIMVPIVVLACIIWLGVLAFANVRERVTEIGILRALGVRSWQILLLFLCKSFIAGALGGIIGYAVGAFTAHRLWAPAYVNVDVWQPMFLLTVLVGAPVIGMLASFAPAVWAARQDPAVILQQE